MQALFPGYGQTSEEDRKAAWAEAIIVVDTNVLLNIYRLPTEASDDLLATLDGLQKRLWIPHQVALEFQRNRHLVIADQLRRFGEVRAKVSKQTESFKSEMRRPNESGRHRVISVNTLVESVQNASDLFLKALEEEEQKQGSITHPDPLLEKLDALFTSENIGKPYEDQASLESLYKDGETRYALLQPPGFEDQASKKDSFVYGGLKYVRKFGDLIVWKQLLQFAKEKSINSVIFVTDDTKDDWWWTISCNGPKTLGPRPELIEEIDREAGVKTFLMYSSDRFLLHASQQLGRNLKPNSVEQVQEVSHQTLLRTNRVIGQQAVSLAYHWLTQIYPAEQLYLRTGFPDIALKIPSKKKRGFEVQYLWNDMEALKRTSASQVATVKRRGDERGYEMTVIFVAQNARLAELAASHLTKVPLDVRCVVGFVNNTEGQNKFISSYTFGK